MEISKDETLGKIFSVDAQEYDLCMITVYDKVTEFLSVRTLDVFRENRLFFVSDLLNTTPAQLMCFRGYQDAVLREVQCFVEALRQEKPEELGLQDSEAETDSLELTPEMEFPDFESLWIATPIEVPLRERYTAVAENRDHCEIHRLKLTQKLHQDLENSGIMMIRDMLQYTPAELIRKCGIPLHCLPEIEDRLFEFEQELVNPKELELPEPDVQPEFDAEPVSEVQRELDVEPVSEVQPELDVEPMTEVRSEIEVQTEIEAQPELEADPEIKVQVEAEAQQGTDVQPELEAEPEVKVQPEAEAQQGTNVQPELEVEPGIKVQPEAEAQQGTDVQPELEVEPGIKVQPEAEVQQGTEVQEASEVQPEPEVQPDAKTQTESKVQAKTDLSTQSGIQLEPKVQPQPDVQLKGAASNEKTFAESYGINPEKYRHTDIFEYGLSVRTSNVFRNNGIHSVYDLLVRTPEQLMEFRNFGKTSMSDVKKLIDSLQESPESNVQRISDAPQEYLALLRPYIRRIAGGDFSFIEDLVVQDPVRTAAMQCRDAYELIGSELVAVCMDTPGKVMPLLSTLTDFIKQENRRKKLTEILAAVPPNRRGNRVRGYINAYTQKENVRSDLLEIYGSPDAPLESVLDMELHDHSFDQMCAFLNWCSFDLSSEIESMFDFLYQNDRMKLVVQQRTRKVTLEQIGTELGVTRERVRQIELKAKRIFQKRQSRIKIISKIAADLNSASVVMPEDLVDYCGNRFEEVLFLLRSCESANFAYDQTLNLFAIGDDSISERATAFVDSLPEIIQVKKRKDYLKQAEEEYDIPPEVAQKALLEVYHLTGDVYHRNRITLGAICQEIIGECYPDGMHIYDPAEIERFRNLVHQKYGDVPLPQNDRALTARIAGVCVLCGKGRYRLKQKTYIPRLLEKQIKSYIDDSDEMIFMTNTLYHVFQEDLQKHGINNKYYLQGILRELFGDCYTFTRDYVSRDPSVTSIYSSVVNRIKKSMYPVSKIQLRKAFPGLPDIALNLATTDPEILNYFGEYLHASRLTVSEQEKQYLRKVIDHVLKDGQVHHSSEFYELVMQEKPEIMTRNFVLFQIRAYSLLEYLFRDNYEFSRPFIAPLGTEIGRPTERLREFVYDQELVDLSELSDYINANHFHVPSLLTYINSCNDKYLLINHETMMEIEKIGINQEIACRVEELAREDLTATSMIRELTCWSGLPAVKVPWTEWLVYSVLNKWAQTVEVAPSNIQFRLSVPLVAPKGSMQPDPFAEVYKEVDYAAGDLATGYIQDLDNIDDLLLELLDDELLEEELWD